MISLREIVAMQDLKLLAEYCEGFSFDEVREHGKILRVNIDVLNNMIAIMEEGP